MNGGDTVRIKMQLIYSNYVVYICMNNLTPLSYMLCLFCLLSWAMLFLRIPPFISNPGSPCLFPDLFKSSLYRLNLYRGLIFTFFTSTTDTHVQSPNYNGHKVLIYYVIQICDELDKVNAFDFIFQSTLYYSLKFTLSLNF